MRHLKVWLLITLALLLSLVANPFADKVWAATLPLGTSSPTSSVTPDALQNNPCAVDPSEHTVSFVEVEPGVQLEVLDWGGTGDTLVLLTGLGDNAHVYDGFAYQFIDQFHVIGITRRGFGRSSQPAEGYDLATRAKDDIAVLDKLNIDSAFFVGHSIAGTEMAKLGATYPTRVKKLVFMDGLDNASGGWSKIPQPPGAPELTDADLASVLTLDAADARLDGFRKPLAALCNLVQMDPSGRILGPISPPEVASKIQAGLTPAEYNRIKAPTLGIFNSPNYNYRSDYYPYLDRAKQLQFERSIRSLTNWTAGAIQRFRTGIKGSRVITIPNANHYVYIVYEAMVVREVRKFLLGK